MVQVTNSNKLALIEACRGVAATAVVLYHAARHFGHSLNDNILLRFIQFGHAGVDLFFVISGFIILYVHYGELSRPQSLTRYLERRLTRIFPTYWVALVLTIVLALAGGHALPDFTRFVWSALLLPSREEPLLGVAWTLRFEIVYYLLFCLLIISVRIGLVIFMVWAAWIVGMMLCAGTMDAVPASLYGTYNIEFFFGMGVAWWLRRYPVPVPNAILVVGVGLFTCVGVFENLGIINGYANTARLLYGIPSTIIILGAAGASCRRTMRVPKVLRILGSASYSIYLFQLIFIGLAWKTWLALGLASRLPVGSCYPILAVAGVGGGVIMSHLIEYPLMDFVRRFRIRSELASGINGTGRL